MKYYSCHTLSSNYDIALNRIFYTGRFRDAFTARFRLCPRGLTMSCCTNMRIRHRHPSAFVSRGMDMRVCPTMVLNTPT